jgi:enoyl-CoA hydratase/carnithine racemase
MKRNAKRGVRGASRARKVPASKTRSSPSRLEIRRDSGCVTATLFGPDGNRISAAMATALMELAQEAEDDASIRLLAVTGTGGVFCRGFDDDVDPQVVETLAALAKPTVALIDGDALDEGLELAMALDIRAAAAHGHFGQAMTLGLVTYLAETPDQFAALTAQLIESITSRAPLAARLVKEAVVKGFDMTLGQGIRLEEDLYALLQTTEDRAEGVRSFLEKRKPLFKGV